MTRRIGRLPGAAAALLTLLVCAACATTPRLPSPPARTADAHLAARVEDALLHDPWIYARHIDVGADGGVIRLSGLVWESDDLFEARRIALGIPGVTSVISELELVRGGKAR